MAKRGKTIQVYLMDGEANGRIKATISNWNGLAYKIPRSKLSLCKERDDLSQSSVYFLFGNPLMGVKTPVYIGQAGVRKNGGGILTRLFEHDKNPEKAYWTEAVVFTTSNNSFGQTELSYLENRFCMAALSANRYDVKNVIEPTPGNITEEKESELEEYADYAELILGVLGYKVFDSVETMPEAQHLAPEVPANTSNTPKPHATKPEKAFQLPALPDRSLPIGKFVRTAMNSLSQSGYVFSEEEINKMCTPEWSKTVFHTGKPFLRRYIKGTTTTRDSANYVRFWATPFMFGSVEVLVSKEWYADDYDRFITWYNSL